MDNSSTIIAYAYHADRFGILHIDIVYMYIRSKV